MVELSAFYFDILKDRLYTYAPNSLGRRSAQTALWRIGEALVRLLAPILSFTCEEVWGYLPADASRGESVHFEKFPTAADILGDSKTATEDAVQREDWKILRTVREQVLKKCSKKPARKRSLAKQSKRNSRLMPPIRSRFIRFSRATKMNCGFLFIVLVVCCFTAGGSRKTETLKRHLSKQRCGTESVIAAGITRLLLARTRRIPRSANAWSVPWR